MDSANSGWSEDSKRTAAPARWAALAMAAAVACGCSDGGSAGPTLPAGWVELPAMPTGLGEAAAVAWAGKIYVVGGFDTRREVQVLDVASETWERAGMLPEGTDNAGAAAVDGKLYVVGGEGGGVLVLEVSSGQWSYGPPLPRPRFSSVVELLGGELHLVGGWSYDRRNNVSVDTHDALELASGTYRARAAAPTARNHALAGVIGGKLYVTGGRAPGHEGEDASNVVATEVYDPATDAWATLAPLPTPRSGGASAVLDGKLYVLGGGLPGTEVNAVVERYDPAADRWERLGDMPSPVTGHRALAVGGSIYVIGGFATREGKRVASVGDGRVLRYTPER